MQREAERLRVRNAALVVAVSGVHDAIHGSIVERMARGCVLVVSRLFDTPGVSCHLRQPSGRRIPVAVRQAVAIASTLCVETQRRETGRAVVSVYALLDTPDASPTRALEGGAGLASGDRIELSEVARRAGVDASTVSRWNLPRDGDAHKAPAIVTPELILRLDDYATRSSEPPASIV